MMGNGVNIGGVSFANGIVAQQQVSNVDKTTDKGTWTQVKYYTVTLRDGTKLAYEQQADSRNATVQILDDGSVNFAGLSNANIVDTEKNDVYRLLGCEFTTVDSYRTKKGTFEGADQDKISGYNRELQDGTIQQNYENKAKCNNGDTLTNIYKQPVKAVIIRIAE